MKLEEDLALSTFVGVQRAENVALVSIRGFFPPNEKVIFDSSFRINS